MVSKNIAIIPARGGSKRIPQKNIIDFFGKPLIAWTIEAALQSGCFDRVLVSTDDAAIAELAKSLGADCPFLRNNAADDYSPVSLATLAALNQAEEYWDVTFDLVTQLMPNCPLRNANDIKASLIHFNEHATNFQISCFSYGWINPWWAVKIGESKQPTPLFPESLNKRSQDLDKLYCPTGAIWIGRSSSLKESQTFYGPNHIFCSLPWTSAVDIDELDDLQMAKAVKRMLEEEPYGS